MVKVQQYGIYWVDLNPTRGAEINKIRPCVVVSPDELNEHLATVIVIPLTSQVHNYPWRMNTMVDGKQAEFVVDQIKSLDKLRIGKKMCDLSNQDINHLKQCLKEMLID
jgi:mRNA interferase MazF